MTLRIAVDHQRFVIRAIVASVLFHASCLGFVIFNFQRKQIPEQPLVVFLGSILRQYDVANADLAPPSHDNTIADEMIAAMQSKLQSSTGRLSAVPANTTSKPSLSAKPIGRPKKDIKNLSEFLPSENPKDSAQPETSLEPKIAPRQPLTLEPHDPH